MRWPSILKAVPARFRGSRCAFTARAAFPEGSYPFWKTLFEAISGAGRIIEIDMHAKGVDQKMIDIATATGMPVKLGAKYSAEHQSLGYQQADIRALEIPDPNSSRSMRALQPEQRFATLYALWLCRLSARGCALQAVVPAVAGHATASALHGS